MTVYLLMFFPVVHDDPIDRLGIYSTLDAAEEQSPGGWCRDDSDHYVKHWKMASAKSVDDGSLIVEEMELDRPYTFPEVAK